MKFIARDTDYAVRALVLMAKMPRNEKRGVITVEKIVSELNLPERFTRKILQRLAREKILASYKGKDGGFSFAVPPHKIRLTDIIEVFQGKPDITNCVLKGRICPGRSACPLRRKLKDIGLMVNRKLGGITIADLIRPFKEE